MDFFSWLPVIIFIYAVATIFGSDNKKGPNRRPSNRPQGSQSSRTTYSRPETKSSRPSWREMFEELEQELFPKEIRTSKPSQTSTTRYQTPVDGYRKEGTEGIEGVWGTEGRGGHEGDFSREGTIGQEGSSSGTGSYGRVREKAITDKSQLQPTITSTVQQGSPVLTAMPQNPLVQGIIWSEVLGKPRAYNKMVNRRRY